MKKKDCVLYATFAAFITGYCILFIILECVIYVNVNMLLMITTFYNCWLDTEFNKQVCKQTKLRSDAYLRVKRLHSNFS